jgi:hypothetical protein
MLPTILILLALTLSAPSAQRPSASGQSTSPEVSHSTYDGTARNPPVALVTHGPDGGKPQTVIEGAPQARSVMGVVQGSPTEAPKGPSESRQAGATVAPTPSAGQDQSSNAAQGSTPSAGQGDAALRVFTILTALFAAYGVVWKGYEVLNRDRDRVLTGASDGQHLSPSHRRAILENDWMPMHIGLIVFILVVTVGLIIGPIVLDEQNPGIKLMSRLAGGLGVVAFVAYASTFPRDWAMLRSAIASDALMTKPLVGALHVRRCVRRRQLQDFVVVGRRLIVLDGVGVASPDFSELRQLRLAIRVMKRRRGQIAFWVAYCDGIAVGRISAQFLEGEIQALPDAMFGYFGGGADPRIASVLLETAAQWLLSHGHDQMTGPFEYSANGRLGVLTSGFNTPPVIDIPHNPAWTAEVLEQAGMVRAANLACWISSVERSRQRVAVLSSAASVPKGLVVEEITMETLPGSMRDIQDVYNLAWSGNDYFLALDPDELNAYVDDLEGLLSRGYAALARYNGRACGIVVAMPDIADLLSKSSSPSWKSKLASYLVLGGKMLGWKPVRVRVMLLGVIPGDYAGSSRRAIALALCDKMLARLAARGIEHADWSWTLASNVAIARFLADIGAVRYKQFALFTGRCDSLLDGVEAMPV